MKKLILLQFIFLAAICTHAQESITGVIPDWPGGSGQVGVMSMMGPPEVLGTFDDQGKVEIPLKPDFIAEAKKKVEEANASASDGWTASMNTLGKSFSCGVADLEVVNGEQAISGFPGMSGFMLFNMEEKKRYGYLLVANSKDFVESMVPYKFKPGYQLEWYYVDEDGSVRGDCVLESYALNQKDIYAKTTTYDLDFKKGWNIVKYEIEEVYTDGEGNSYPMKDSYTVLEKMPEGVQFVFLED